MNGARQSAQSRASSVLRLLARRTNLLVASRRFAIVGSGELADALRLLLLALGARESATGDGVDYLFLAHPEPVAPSIGATELRAHLAGVAPGERPVVVVDSADRRAAPDLGAGRSVRPGVTEYDLDGTAFCLIESEIAADATGREGIDRIDWARRFMVVSEALAGRLGESGAARGVRIGISMVLEPKTAVLALLLRSAGADVSIYAHSDETDDAVAGALRDHGLPVFASSAAGFDKQRALALEFLRHGMELLLDDGSHLIRLAHLETPEIVETLIGAAEETTSGLRPLRLMQRQGALRIPVVAVNDARSKTDFDNLYGTGQSCVFAILDLLDAAVAENAAVAPVDMTRARVVVAGFGPVGTGVARHCSALGARVVIAEVDPVRALQAAFAGYDVRPLTEAVADADLVVSATGMAATIGVDVLEACAADAVVAVAGGVPQEVSIDAAIAAGATRARIAHKIERLTLPSGRAVRLLDDGGCINITAGEGNPIEIMDLSFGVQLEAVAPLLAHGRRLAPGIHSLSTDADGRVAGAALAAAGLGLDAPSAEQRESMTSWLPARFFEGPHA